MKTLSGEFYTNMIGSNFETMYVGGFVVAPNKYVHGIDKFVEMCVNAGSKSVETNVEHQSAAAGAGRR